MSANIWMGRGVVESPAAECEVFEVSSLLVLEKPRQWSCAGPHVFLANPSPIAAFWCGERRRKGLVPWWPLLLHRDAQMDALKAPLPVQAGFCCLPHLKEGMVCQGL